MDFDEAYLARVTPEQAINLLREHGIPAYIVTGGVEAWTDATYADGRAEQERVEFPILCGTVRAKELFDWLGY